MDTRKEFPVYHGTTWSSGCNILQSKSFFLSAKEDDWLGTGVYFWHTFKDAQWWSKHKCDKPEYQQEQPVILSAALRCDPHRLVDLDDKVEMNKLDCLANELKAWLAADPDPALDFESDEQMMCFVCNYYKLNNDIDLMSYTFFRSRRNAAGFPCYEPQKQYCATSNDIIFDIRMEAEDYVI